MNILFAISLFILLFVYVLYGPIMVVFKRLKSRKSLNSSNSDKLPTISLIVPAFNEEGWIRNKIENSFELEYPSEKIEIIVVSDGSSDQTASIVSEYGDRIVHIHSPERKGKIDAMDRASLIANNDILIFTDANTDLNKSCILNIARHFDKSDVGMVAGEKKVLATKEGESASGEGLYWKYESWLKSLDSDVASVIGAAGELFAIRSNLYERLPNDTLLDDFMLSTRVLEKSFRIVYEPKALAIEYGSASYKEEWKRKVRICAGGIQSIIRSSRLFDMSTYGLKSFAFIVHRASRWTIAPLALVISFITSLILSSESWFYQAYFGLGVFALLITYLAIQKNLKNLPKPLLLIVYFTFMHISAIAGWFRYFSNNQSVNWEKAARIAP
ncbi:MAG: glycosyltransferase family 2 protein [Balneolaceae bacterium]